MPKHTLKLPGKPASDSAIQAAKEITAADVMEWLKKNTLPNVATGASIDPEAGIRQQAAYDAASFDWKYDAPVESKPFDPASIPAHARTIPVQAPPKVWGNPRLVPSN